MRIGFRRSLAAGLCAAASASSLTTAFASPPSLSTRPTGSRVAASGPLLAWGNDEEGQLGDGSVMNENAPVAVNPPAQLRVTSARVGPFAVAVAADGRVWAWGRGKQGELGNGKN